MANAFRLSVSGTPEGDIDTDWQLDGSEVTPGTTGEPELTITLAYKDFEKLKSGDLQPSVAYMQGLMKSTGNTGVLIDLLASPLGVAELFKAN